MVPYLLILPAQSPADVETGVARAEAMYRVAGNARPAPSGKPYEVVDRNALGSFVRSEDRWEALIHGDGRLINFAHDVIGLDLSQEDGGEDLGFVGRQRAAVSAYRAAGGTQDLWFQSESPYEGGGKGAQSWDLSALVSKDGVVYLDTHYSFVVGRRSGRVLKMHTGDIERSDEPPALSESTAPNVSIESARATVAAFAFACGKDLTRSRYFFPRSTMVENLAEPRLAAWVPKALPPNRIGAERFFQDLSADDLATGQKGMARLVWWIRLTTVRQPGEPPDTGLYFAKVDAHTGSILDLEVNSPFNGFGATPAPKPRLPIALFGGASLTVGGKTKAVRLVPVSARRPFKATGRALAGAGKRVFEVEYDPKAGLVRFRGKLARTLDP